jgi:hypothetical protein
VILQLLLPLWLPLMSPNADDCTRGEPTPVVRKAVFPRTTFRLQPDRRSATETVAFPNGDKLQIKNYGCEYYCLRFRFATTRFASRTTEPKIWYNQAATLLGQAAKGIDAPIDLGGAVKALRRQAAILQPAFGTELDFGGDEIRSFVTLDKVEALPGGKGYAVVTTCAVGPL